MFRTIRRKIFRLALVSGAGAAANYFFDKERGPERRQQARGKATSLLNKETPVADWQSHSANGFDTATTASPVATATAPTVTDILATPDTEVDVLVVEPAPGGSSGNGL